MTDITFTLNEAAGLTGITLEVLDVVKKPMTGATYSPTEVSSGVFTATVTEDLVGPLYFLDIMHNGVRIERLGYRNGPVVPTHDSEHMPDGTSGQVLIHNGTEFAASNNELVSNIVAADIQGHYGLLTNFYFTGSVPTSTEIGEEDIDEWVDINFTVDAAGNFDARPDVMKLANSVGHTGSGTQASPILFDLEGLTQSSSCNFRASLTFEPDVDESQLETRLLFNRHSGTTPSDDFAIAEVTLGMTQGADVEYDAEPMLSFFVGDTIDTNAVGDAGKCRFQVRSSVEGTLRMRALTWYIQS